MSEELSEFEALKNALEDDLLRMYGPLLTGESLHRSLGYVSKDAFRQSVMRKTVPVTLFNIDNRRGWYALSKDVAHHLAEQRLGIYQP